MVTVMDNLIRYTDRYYIITRKEDNTMNVELNSGQKDCLAKLLDWWNHKLDYQQVFSISGPAGSGKTFLIRVLVDQIPSIRMDDVLFVAYVGKAALNLSKSGLNASTIHSAIYHPIDVVTTRKDKDGKVIMNEGRPIKDITVKFVLKDELDKDYKLIVVDEAPMVDKRVATDLLSFGIPIIALGDLNQLPPVIGDPYFLTNPDALLTEVIRQKADSPILALSQHIIRNPYPRLASGNYKNQLFIVKKKDFMAKYQNMLTVADAVICGRNSTRNELNKLIREMYFRQQGMREISELALGDKLICRKNNWMIQKEGIFLINGLIGRVECIYFEDANSKIIPIDFKPEFMEDSFEHVELSKKFFFGNKFEKEWLKTHHHRGNLFEYGYAITCHLSQGSQYDTVIVFNERIGDIDFYRQWLYTAVTRASKKLLLLV